MRSRQDLVELFSTFLEWDGDRPRRWLADSRLRRNMQSHLAATPVMADAPADGVDHFWGLYWHKCWQTPSPGLARDHLSAYVQEPCYWAAQKATLQFTSTQYSLADCFQMAIAKFDRILKGFQSDQGFNFKNYASVTFATLIRESLRQRQEIDICTDWGLLRKISQKRLVEALHNAGLTDERIRLYVLVWSAFRSLYVPTQATVTRKLTKPDEATLNAIAQTYNRDRTQLLATAPSATTAQIEQWLLACAKAVRQYLYPNTVSINAPKGSDDAGEWLDNLPDQSQPSLLSELIVAEEVAARQQQCSDLQTVLQEAIAQLSPDLQTILELYYAQGLTQQEMAQQLDTKQYTVSRRLAKAREQLLMALAQWMTQTLHKAPTSDVLTHTSAALEEWLKTHYHSPDLPSVAE